MRTVRADEQVRRGRLAKARQFSRVAEDAQLLSDEADTVADTVVTLYVHAGIAAADAICARALGEHAKRENHSDAVTLLRSINQDGAKHLNRLLRMKTRAGYGHDPISKTQLDQAKRAVDVLLEIASA